MKFKSCCMDILWNKSSPVSMNIYKQLLIRRTKIYKNHNCEYINPSAKYDENEMYLMISTCPTGANVDYKVKCISRNYVTTLQALIPVDGVAQYLYRNSFCAHCNSIEHFEMVNITVYCPWLTLHDSKATLNVVRLCDLPLHIWNKTCNVENEFYDLCKAYR